MNLRLIDDTPEMFGFHHSLCSACQRAGALFVLDVADQLCLYAICAGCLKDLVRLLDGHSDPSDAVATFLARHCSGISFPRVCSREIDLLEKYWAVGCACRLDSIEQCNLCAAAEGLLRKAHKLA